MGYTSHRLGAYCRPPTTHFLMAAFFRITGGEVPHLPRRRSFKDDEGPFPSDFSSMGFGPSLL